MGERIPCQERDVRIARLGLRDGLLGKVDSRDGAEPGELLTEPSHAATQIENPGTVKLERPKHVQHPLAALERPLIDGLPIPPIVPMPVPALPLLIDGRSAWLGDHALVWSELKCLSHSQPHSLALLPGLCGFGEVAIGPALRCGVNTCSGFFFFQAEDGIRDGRVTGVQTCALPISTGFSRRSEPRTRGVEPIPSR